MGSPLEFVLRQLIERPQEAGEQEGLKEIPLDEFKPIEARRCVQTNLLPGSKRFACERTMLSAKSSAPAGRA